MLCSTFQCICVCVCVWACACVCAHVWWKCICACVCMRAHLLGQRLMSLSVLHHFRLDISRQNLLLTLSELAC